MPTHIVSDDAELRAAILDAEAGDTILFDADILLAGDLPALQASITIDGATHTLNGGGQFRGLFIGAWQTGTATQIAVSVTIQNLDIAHAAAIGGDGGGAADFRGGGGAGLGGAIFVANLATVTVSNVSLADNRATGGNGGVASGGTFGGGGGMGGDGGDGGGGGLGVGANGGIGSTAGGAGIATAAAGGAAGSGSAGGINGGGGGGSLGGGGGVGGSAAAFPVAGSGGFGGGGGGGGGSSGGGDGGFGGGGGSAGGNGGFGGGGGAFGGGGGFGGGAGSPGTGGGGSGGGGGAGLGGGIFVQEGGTLILAGTLSIDGSTVVGGNGTDGGASGSGFGSGIFLQGSGTLTFSPGAGATQTVADAIADQTGSGNAGSYGLVKTGAGTLVLDAANTFTGGMTLNGGTLSLGHNDGLGTGALTVLGSTLDLKTDVVAGNDVDLQADLAVDVSGTSASMTGAIGGAFGITKTGSALHLVSGSASYSGPTRIDEGTLLVSGGNAIGDQSAVTVAAGAVLDLLANETIGSLSGAGTVQDGDSMTLTLTIGANNADAVFSGTILDGANILAVVKIGTGRQTLSGTSGYTGATTVTAGTLIVDGSIASSSDVTVEDGATLGGGGTTGAVTVASGGTLAAGASAGILNTGSVALVAGAMFEAEIGGTTPGVGGYDQVKVTGTVGLGGATLDALLISGFDPAGGSSFRIIDNDGSDAVVGTFAGLAEGASFDIGSREFTITYLGGDGNDVVLTAVAGPTPPTGVTIIGTNGGDLVDATVTVPGQPLPTALGDLIAGRGGKDDLSGLDGDDEVHGGKGTDLVHGNAGDDLIFGGKAGDALDGGAGNDWLNGGAGNDRLTGGEGDDSFAFANPRQPDTVMDWTQGDVIALQKSAFKGIGPKGGLAENRFQIGGEAETKKQKILYDDETGWLSYAKQGSNTANPLAFAKIGKGLTDFDHTDVMVI